MALADAVALEVHLVVAVAVLATDKPVLVTLLRPVVMAAMALFVLSGAPAALVARHRSHPQTSVRNF
jgi:hypothetical protein